MKHLILSVALTACAVESTFSPEQSEAGKPYQEEAGKWASQTSPGVMFAGGALLQSLLSRASPDVAAPTSPEERKPRAWADAHGIRVRTLTPDRVVKEGTPTWALTYMDVHGQVHRAVLWCPETCQVLELQ